MTTIKGVLIKKGQVLSGGDSFHENCKINMIQSDMFDRPVCMNFDNSNPVGRLSEIHLEEGEVKVVVQLTEKVVDLRIENGSIMPVREPILPKNLLYDFNIGGVVKRRDNKGNIIEFDLKEVSITAHKHDVTED